MNAWFSRHYSPTTIWVNPIRWAVADRKHNPKKWARIDEIDARLT